MHEGTLRKCFFCKDGKDEVHHYLHCDLRWEKLNTCAKSVNAQRRDRLGFNLHGEEGLKTIRRLGMIHASYNLAKIHNDPMNKALQIVESTKPLFLDVQKNLAPAGGPIAAVHAIAGPHAQGSAAAAAGLYLSPELSAT